MARPRLERRLAVGQGDMKWTQGRSRESRSGQVVGRYNLPVVKVGWRLDERNIGPDKFEPF